MFGKFEKYLAAENLWLRSQLEKSQERIDRLTEALAKKNELSLVMPQTPVQMPEFVGHHPLEKSPGWFDHRSAPSVKNNSGGTTK